MMYKTFYSLLREPFAKDTDPSEAYPGAAFQEALQALEYVKRTRGIGLLIGEPGVGKTFALRALKESLSPSLHHVVYFPLSTGGVMDFYRGLALGLGEEPKYRKVDLFRQIQQAIERLHHERRITPVFISDEMHFAKDAFLQDIAILFNFEMDSTNPFVLILAGLPHLQGKLRLNQHRPLDQRIIMHHAMPDGAAGEGRGGGLHRASVETGRGKASDLHAVGVGGDRSAVAGVAPCDQHVGHDVLVVGASAEKGRH